MDEQRLVDLEIKVTHLESTLQDLQDVALGQQKEIAKLQETLARYVRRFEDLVSGGLEIGPANEKPPHY